MIQVLFLLASAALFYSFLHLQALFINGVKGSTDGYVEVLPDGSRKNRGMIFFPVANWITRTKRVSVRYHKKQLQELRAMLLEKYKSVVMPDTLRMLLMMDDSNILLCVSEVSEDRRPYEKRKQEQIQLVLQYLMFLKDRESIGYLYAPRNKVFALYKIIEVPVMPALVRKPLVECIKCMSSFWGAVTYWPVMLSLFGFHNWQVPLFIADVFMLVYLNHQYYKKSKY